MSGYDFSAWKSNNAIDAENKGLLKAGQLAKRLGVSLAAVKAVCFRAEWHHVGGGFAKVDYYSPDQSEIIIEQCRRFDDSVRPVTWLNCTAEWLEWPTFKVGRFAKNRSAPKTVRVEGCSVTRATPNTLVIRLRGGEEITKRSTTRGLVVKQGDTVLHEVR